VATRGHQADIQRPGRADWLTSDKEAVMRVVALISWIVTALAGATLFSIWLSRGGLRRQGPAASRFPRH
jgi:hypothetical protein